MSLRYRPFYWGFGQFWKDDAMASVTARDVLRFAGGKPENVEVVLEQIAAAGWLLVPRGVCSPEILAEYGGDLAALDAGVLGFQPTGRLR